jgi:hypothetical protein
VLADGLSGPVQLTQTGQVSNSGSNYYRSNGPGTVPRPTSIDLFRNGVYNKTFTQLKAEAIMVFEEIFQRMKARETPPRTNNPKDYLLYINRNFTGRGNGMNIMRFYTHNLGMYQFLAMYGYQYPNLYPYSGNCTVIAIIRISLFERLTHGKFRNSVSFVVQGKNRVQNNRVYSGQTEVCHYGLRTHNMSPPERLSGGNFQRATHRPWEYLRTMSNITTYGKIYDVLSANSIFRAKQRAVRNQRFSSRKQILNSFSFLIKQHMNYETKQLHNHILGPTPVTHNPQMNG